MPNAELLRLLDRGESLGRALRAGPLDNEIPTSAQRFHLVGSIVCPNPNTSNTLVVSYQVPDGMRASVRGIVNIYQGQGQIQGDSASISWAIRLDGSAFVRDYNQIVTTLGSFDTPFPVVIDLLSGQLLEYLVTVPAGSPITTGGNNRVICAFVGFHWAPVKSPGKRVSSL